MHDDQRLGDISANCIFMFKISINPLPSRRATINANKAAKNKLLNSSF
jgi:hypothetical protein